MSEGTLFCETSCSARHYFRRAPAKRDPQTDEHANPNCVWRRDCFTPTSSEEQRPDFECARQVMEFPLEFVPNKSFEAWSRDQKTENEVLGSMPTCGESSCKAEPPYGASPYFAGICQFALLTREQEVHLFRKMNYLKYKASELRRRLNSVRPQEALMAYIEKVYQEIVATRNQIVCANLRLVVWIAKGRARPDRSILELISDGNVSLMRAVERFDYSRGNRFGTYAGRAIIKNFASAMRGDLRKRRRFHTNQSGRVKATTDSRDNQYQLEAAQSGRQAALDDILRRLDDRERRIIVCRFGLRHGHGPRSLRQLSGALRLSRERIRQIEARAIGKLRRIVVLERPAGLVEWEE